MKSQNLYKIVAKVIGSILALLILMAAWLYTGNLTQAKISVFRIFPYPLAFVGPHPILMKDYLLRYDIGQKMSGADVVAQNPELFKNQIYQKLVDEAKLNLTALKYGVSVENSEIEAEYALRKSQTDLGNYRTFEDLISFYGFNLAQYKQQLIAPALFLVKMQSWFNGNKELNKEAFEKAENIVQRIKKGESMIILAVGLSDEEGEKAVGGDMGLVDPVRLLPEIRDPVLAMNVGEAKVIPSRLGLHVIRVEEKNGNQLHLREIFIKTADFNQWLAKQTSNISVRQLVKI